MKLAWSVALGVAAVTATDLPAAAASIATTIKTYPVAGRSGEELLRSMNKHGPKHGFLSRAIAQTQYTIEWDVKVDTRGANCRLQRARAIMQMTYTYPKPSSNLTPAMRRKWDAFMAGVRKHEENHGTLARQMVNRAERSVAGLRVANDPNCRKTTALVKERVAAIYLEYEAKQVVFDKREHREGGNIYRLIAILMK